MTCMMIEAIKVADTLAELIEELDGQMYEEAREVSKGIAYRWGETWVLCDGDRVVDEYRMRDVK